MRLHQITTRNALKEKLAIDEERYGELSVKLIKKLNQEKLKQVICI